MARATNRLSARTVASLLKKPGRHSDGGGLYLSVSADGSRRRWVFLFRWKAAGEKGAGKLTEMGLGSAGTVSLARARERAAQARAQLANKQNPLNGRKAEARLRPSARLLTRSLPHWRWPGAIPNTGSSGR